MVEVKYTRHLVRFFPNLANHEVLRIEGERVSDVVANLEDQFPGLGGYLVDEHGRLRKHVNIFVDGEMIHDRELLSDSVEAAATVHIFQALSGG